MKQRKTMNYGLQLYHLKKRLLKMGYDESVIEGMVDETDPKAEFDENWDSLKTVIEAGKYPCEEKDSKSVNIDFWDIEKTKKLRGEEKSQEKFSIQHEEYCENFLAAYNEFKAGKDCKIPTNEGCPNLDAVIEACRCGDIEACDAEAMIKESMARDGIKECDIIKGFDEKPEVKKVKPISKTHGYTNKERTYPYGDSELPKGYRQFNCFGDAERGYKWLLSENIKCILIDDGYNCGISKTINLDKKEQLEGQFLKHATDINKSTSEIKKVKEDPKLEPKVKPKPKPKPKPKAKYYDDGNKYTILGTMLTKKEQRDLKSNGWVYINRNGKNYEVSRNMSYESLD